MFDFLSKALEWLKSPKRWSALLLVCIALLFLPSVVLQRMGLTDIVQRYRPWISLCGLFSVTVLVVEFADWLRGPVNAFRKQKDCKAVLGSLTPPEMKIIAGYFKAETDTQYFDATDGLVGGLEAKGLIYRTSSISRAYTPTFAYNLQPYVREIIRKNPAILQVFTVILSRKANTGS
jgi:hypothetical protein